MSKKSLTTSTFVTAALFAGLLSFAKPASADTVYTFGSYAGAQPAGLSNGATYYDNRGANGPQTSFSNGVATVYNPLFEVSLPGTTWLTYDPNTGATGDNGGITTYTTGFIGNLAAYFGSIAVLADDTATVYLNGVLLGDTAVSTLGILNPNGSRTYNIPTGTFINGNNLFYFVVTNGNDPKTSGGPTGFDFLATAQTPEPSSFLMLGTGIIGAAGMMRRRLSK